MQKDIHPKYNTAAQIVCACGNVLETGSTMDEIKTDLCSACHPFYTGKQKLVDTARRVEKFQTKLGAKKETVGKRARRAKRDEEKAAKTEATEKAAADKVKKVKAKAKKETVKAEKKTEEKK